MILSRDAGRSRSVCRRLVTHTTTTKVIMVLVDIFGGGAYRGWQAFFFFLVFCFVLQSQTEMAIYSSSTSAADVLDP